MSRSRHARLSLLLLYVALVGALFVFEIEPEQAREWLRSSGGWGPLVMIAAFAALQPLGVASHLFIVSAAMVWEPWAALLVSWVGAMAAGCTAFAFARYVGRAWVQDRLSPRLEGYDQRLASHGLQTVLVMRLLLFTFGPMQWLFGVSKVRFWPFLLGTAIGLLPGIIIETWLGSHLLEWLA